MCGITGIWQKDKQPIPPELLIQMRDTMFSRGPDDAGIWINENIGFGHRRLSVIDTSYLGHQPMIDEETGSVIVFNGEIYNYLEIKKELEKDGIRFKSKSDTEVILKAYRKFGVDCINKFMGMFCFAIWDNKLKSVFIARDRIGIKPLYYYKDNKIFIFASRLAPIIMHPACPHDIDIEALGLYLEMGYIPAPWSILKNVKKLKPGHTIWIDEKGIAINCYWDISKISIDKSLSKKPDNELIERLDYLLNESVKLHLISDVALGVFLSGGIDSSIITALMCRHTQDNPKTFTIGFEEEIYDESKYAKRISDYLGTSHNAEIMKSQDLLCMLKGHTLHYDEPFADASSLATMMVSHFAKKQVTVCLSGDGGDELFGGYRDYLLWHHLQYFYNIPIPLRHILGKFIAKITNRRFSAIGESFTKKNILKSFVFIRSITKGHNRQSLLNNELLDMENLFKGRISEFTNLDIVSAFCRLDASYFLADDILQKVDVASMSIGLEARVPILDHRIVEFSQSLPIKYKLRNGKGKWLLKKVLSRYMPDKIFERTKRGFVVPLDKWFRNELKDVIREELSVPRIKQFGYLNPRGVKQLVDLHLSNKSNTHQILWALMNLLRWKEAHLK